MAIGTGKRLALLATLAIAAVAPSGAAAMQPGVTTAVRTLHGFGASASTAPTILTIADEMGIDNRISAQIDPAGRLVLTAPEGLGDPDGAGPNCRLDNATPGTATAQQVSCAPGYISAIVGTLGRGNDVFDADSQLSIYVGTVASGQPRPLLGGPGHDRLVGGAAPDLLDGAGGPDSIVGGGGEDFLVGGPGADNVSGGGQRDILLGLGGPDKLNGGASRDVCRGGGGTDRGKNCEVARGIP
jgi:hypothetical protein